MSDICETKWQSRTACIFSRWPRCTDFLTANERRSRSSSTISSLLPATTISAASRATCSASFYRTIGCAPNRNSTCSKLRCLGLRRQFRQRGKLRRRYAECWVLSDTGWWVPNRWNASIVTHCCLEKLAEKSFKWVGPLNLKYCVEFFLSLMT